MRLEEILKIETRHCADGELPALSDADTAFYLAQIKNWDAKKCEALAIVEPVLPIFKMRALLMRGHFDELKSLEVQENSLTHSSEKIEFFLEKARLSNAEGEWASTLEMVAVALSLSPSAVSRMTLLQVSSVAFFELGNFSKTIRILDEIESIITLFPHAHGGFYAKALRIKVLARTDGVEIARKQLHKFIEREISLDADKVLTYLRVLIDLNRLDGKAVYSLCVAAKDLAGLLGDRLYEALALNDMYYAAAENISLKNEAEKAGYDFKRIKLLQEEIEGRSSLTSTTAKSVLLGPSRLEVIDDTQYDFILMRELFLFSLRHGTGNKLEPGKELSAIEFLIKNNESSKKEFFANLWGKSKYTPHLHDSLIANLLSRLRKKYQLEVKIKKQLVVLHSKLRAIQC